MPALGLPLRARALLAVATLGISGPATSVPSASGAWTKGETPAVAIREADRIGTVPHEASAPTPGQAYVVPGLEIEMLWVSPGSFLMGSPADEPHRHKAEGPRTRVTLSKGFWLAKTELTQAQYESVTGENPSSFSEAGGDAPVERVSWTDAMEYCEKLTAREEREGRLPRGYAYTLPTEAEWEYAWRAGTTNVYPGPVDEMAWHKGNSGGTVHPVGRKSPNPWGFHDMGGNVLEWCHDWYGDYPGGHVTDPTGPARGYYRTARGGSWRMEAHVCRSAARSGGSQGRMDYTLGFRVALAPVRSD